MRNEFKAIKSINLVNVLYYSIFISFTIEMLPKISIIFHNVLFSIKSMMTTNAILALKSIMFWNEIIRTQNLYTFWMKYSRWYQYYEINELNLLIFDKDWNWDNKEYFYMQKIIDFEWNYLLKRINDILKW